MKKSRKAKPDKSWWKETIVYQIYPRSFKDSNGDGVGDLQGIIQKLDYIASLGVETLWLNPIFKSPNDDNGYDVSDYRDIMDEFGTMQDFNQLLAELKARDLRLILDLVPNHSSDEHFWFQESRKSKNNPYRDYYFWKPGKDGGGPPTNWESYFAPSAWELDPLTNEYYLHLFSVKQPDLNWENPKVRQEIYDIMRFWLDKGIDGFRIDVLPFISKNLNFPDMTAENFNGNLGHFYANGPRLHEFLQEMHQEVLRHYDCMTVGEGPGVSPQQALLYVGKDRQELHTIYHFEHMDLDHDKDVWLKPVPWSLPDFKKINANWDHVVQNGGWNTCFLGNHDFPRMVSRWGNDQEYRIPSAKLLLTYLLSQRATPYIYQGDELGMTNFDWSDLSRYNDLWAFDAHQKWLDSGKEEAEFMSFLPKVSRDNARTPFQWDGTRHAGFTTGTPWLEVNENYVQINAASQEHEPHSILNYMRKMTQVRRHSEVLIYGAYDDLLPDHPSLYVYTRSLPGQTWLIALNFDASEHDFEWPSNLKIAELVIGNYQESAAVSHQRLKLKPWEAVIYKLES